MAQGQPLSLQLSATDADGDTLLYSATGLPSGATLTPAGQLTWTPAFPQVGAFPITFTASDGNLSSSVSATVTVTSVNQTPRASPVCRVGVHRA